MAGPDARSTASSQPYMCNKRSAEWPHCGRDSQYLVHDGGRRFDSVDSWGLPGVHCAHLGLRDDWQYLG
jgi:hypothetical protein